MCVAWFMYMRELASRNVNAKFTREEVLRMRKMYISGVSRYRLAKIFKANYCTVTNIVRGYTYKNI